jgi:hypothetical protein
MNHMPPMTTTLNYGRKPRLTSVRPVAMASMVLPLGVTLFLMASLKNLLRPIACLPNFSGYYRWLLVEFPHVVSHHLWFLLFAPGGVPRCACVCLHSTRLGLFCSS